MARWTVWRWAGAPGRLQIAAAVLASEAMVEVVLRIGAQPTSADLTRPYVEPQVDITASILLALVATLPVAAAARLPVVSSLPVILAVVLILAQHRPLPVGALVALMICAYSVGLRRSGFHAALVAAPYGIIAITQPWFTSVAGRLGAIALFGLVLGALALGRSRRTRAETAARDATERALADTLIDHAARGERARIARELHDVVAHHISMISVQAETARLTTPELPAEGARHLATIADTARTALAEMRRLLGVLREDAGTGPELAPQPGLQHLNALVDEARASAGTPVRLAVRGTVAPLDPGVELTAYRVVQEALTNARRHAAGAEVDVELDYGTDALRVLVRDNGPGPPPHARPGHGVLGMRERVAAAGGTLWTGAHPAGGYLVTAVLPIGNRP